MTTTFSELVQFSASVSGVGAARLSAALRAQAAGVGIVGADGQGVTIGFESGGVLYSALRAVAAGVGTSTGELSVRRRLQATAGGVGTGRQGVGVRSRLPAISGFAANRLYGEAVGALPALSGYASDPLPVPNLASIIGVLPSLEGEATGLTGTVGTVDVSLPALAGLASNKLYGGVSVALPALLGRSNDEESAFGPSVRAYMYTRDSISASISGAAQISETLTTTGAITGIRQFAADMEELMVHAASLSGALQLSANISEVVTVLTDIEREGSQIVWVVNTESGANWTYRGWNFSSFGEWNGKYFGAGNDGLFELTGDNDDGAPIAASILTGKSDFGTVQQKRMAYVYIGAAADGGLQLTVHTDGGAENTYDIPAQDLLSNSRTAIGKGLRSKYWQLEVTNPDGVDFEIESLELRPDGTIRRI